MWLSFTQTTKAVIAGCQAAWRFFDGVFRVLVPEYVPRNIFRLLWPGWLCGRLKFLAWYVQSCHEHGDGTYGGPGWRTRIEKLRVVSQAEEMARLLARM